MNIEIALSYLEQYGMLFLFLIVFLEYLNLPGFPSGIIMPAIGILIARGSINFGACLLISVLAGLLGSLVLYILGFYVGKRVMDRLCHKYKKMQKPIDKVLGFVDRYGNKSVFITRLIPVTRTLISLVVGTTRLNLVTFILYSTPGILIWNAAYIYAGYAFGNFFLT